MYHKTVLQYLQEIPDPVIRDQAIKNCWKEYGKEWSTDLPAALKRAFLWHRTPEKFQYWNKIYWQLYQEYIGFEHHSAYCI